MTVKNEVVFGPVETNEITYYLEYVGDPPVGIYVPYPSTSTSDAVHTVTQVTSSSVDGNRYSPNSYTMNKYEVNNGIGRSLYYGYFGLYTNSYSRTGPGVNTPSYTTEPIEVRDTNDLLADCIDGLYEKLRGEIDLSVSLAESGQTAKMIRDASKLKVAISSISPKVWARRWLSYKYGWMPLASDLYNSADRIIKRDYDRYTVVSVRRQSAGSGSVTSPYCTGKRFVSNRCLLKCDYNLNDQTFATELAGWTSLNPVSIAWELMPYSFVVDWFYDVGSYIRNLESSFLYRNRFVKGFYTFTTLDSSSANYFREISTPSALSIDSGYGSETLKSLARTPILASPSVVAPRFKADLGASRILTLASLLAVSHK